MADERVDVVVFAGPAGASAPERLMAGGQAAAALDLVETALACPLVGRVLVATGAPEVAGALAGRRDVAVERDPPGVPFHFGRRLLQATEQHGLRRPLYFGAGSAPLLSAGGLEALCRRLLAAEGTVVANNLWSADFFGFTPPAALRRIDLPGDQDNNIPQLLIRQGGLIGEALEPAIENMFNLDSPVDLAVLAVQGTAGPHARRFLDGVALETGRLERAMPVLLRRRAEVTLIGRVATQLWGRSVTDIPGQKRLYVEERGMKAAGREARGEVRSLVGHLLEAVGPRELFAHLAGFSDAVFFDTRPVFGHLRLHLSAADRFNSDLGNVAEISHPLLRELTAAAVEAPVPVLLGGHNIVAGGLWALVQEAWNRADAGLLAAE